MHKSVRTLITLGALWTGIAAAAAPDATDADWRAAARSALAVVDRQQQSILVVDATVPEPGRQALAALRQTIAPEAMPDQETHDLPGGYLRIRQFTLIGTRFAFESTSGPIPKNSHRNCGDTERFFLAQDAQGTWQVDGLRTTMVC